MTADTLLLYTLASLALAATPGPTMQLALSNGIAGGDIGQISVMDRISFVALAAAAGPRALVGLNSGRIKKKRFRAYLVTAPSSAPRRG